MSEERGPTLRRWLAIGTFIAVLWAIGLILWPLRMPLAWAAILAFLMAPLQEHLTQRFGNRRGAAAGALTALTPIAVFAPLVLLGMAFAQQIAGMAASLQSNPQFFDLASWLDPNRHPYIAALAARLAKYGGPDLNAIQDYVRENLQSWAGALAGVSGQLFLNAAGVVLQFCLMLFILFFMLRDGTAWFTRLAQLLPLEPARRGRLFTRLGKVTRAVVYGCGLTAAAQGLLVGIGFAIAGLSGPVVFGVVAAVSALLPFGGAGLVWVPAVLYLAVTGHFGWAIFMLAWGGLVSVSDNFIRPWIISRYTPVATLLVFLGVIGGISAFGLIGFILGPVILVLATELLRFTEESVRRSD
ncbi:MAG: AI-2E family transporter [Steroidobacteraceae bacterium]